MKRRFLTLIFTITAMLICMLGFVACGETVDNFNLSFKVDGETYQTLTTNGEETIQIPDNPTKEGYDFDGWYWDNGEWERPFTANSLLDEPISSDMSVYAKFSAIEYDITYENNGGAHNNPVSYTIEEGFVLSDAEKIGYDFVGWYSEDSYATKVVSISAGSTGEITLYAKYEVINYTITYENTKETENDNATLYTIESQTIVLADLEKSGYIFDGWYNGETKITEIITGSTGNLTLTAHWTPISYSISYENTKGTSNNNETSYTIESEKITLKNLNKTGYTFDGWYNGETKVTEIAKGSTGNLTLSAQWTPIVYSISYNNTKDVLNNNPTSYTIESEMITLIGLEKNGYQFDGWYNNGRKVTEIEKGSTGNLTFTAKWTPTSYQIKYHNVTGATNNNPTMYDVEDQPLVLSAANKVGYTFTGWYTDSACQNKIDEIAIGTTGELNLYSDWEIIEYTATFKDGNTPIDEITFTVETQSIEEPAVPNYVGYTGKWSDYELGARDIYINAVYTPIVYSITYENKKDAINDNAANYTIESETITLIDLERNGYEFDGWYNNGTKVAEIATGSTGNLVLTAQWTPIEYSITYMYDSAIGDYVDNNKNPSTYTIEDEFNFVSLVNKTVGYTFDGWYTEKNVGTGEKVSGIVLGRTGDIIVYAHWALEVYTITYHNVEGLTNTNPTTYTVETDTFEVSDISKTGYTFDGWFADEALTQLADISIEKGNTGNIVLYAKFTVIEYAIEYVLYGGTIEDGSNPSIYTVEDEIDLSNPILTDNTFVGWFTLAEGGKLITKLEQGTTGPLTLYARWIKFDSNGGNDVDYNLSVQDNKITKPEEPEKEYYTFTGWYIDEKLTQEYDFSIPEKNLVLYAKWEAKAYNITYILNGGTNDSENKLTYTIEDNVIFANASKTGYTFVGWFTDDKFTSAIVTELPVGTYGDIVLYANYSINQYTVSFDTDGGTEVESITQNYDTSILAPSEPAKNGYKFVGWYTSKNFNKVYTFTKMSAEDITVYAKWELVTYTITYNLDGGDNSKNNPDTFSINSEDIVFAKPEKLGYTFIGWYSDRSYSATIAGITKGTYNDVEVFAKWQAITYTVTYIVEDDAQNNNITQYTIETDNIELLDAVLKGYTFNGWYKEDLFVTPVYTIAGGGYGNITLYAKFTANEYDVWLDGTEESAFDVSFDLNGASGSVATQTIKENNGLNYPTLPTRNGYVFGGWYTTADCTGELYDFAALITKDTVLYAKWIKADNSVQINSQTAVTLNGTIEQKFVFIPLASGNVTFTTTGSYDTLGILYDANGNILKQDDDTGSDGVNFQIVFNVTAGEVYTIAIRSYSSATNGTTTLHVSGNSVVNDGGYVITGNKTKVTYGENFTLSIPEKREGYKFLGYADENGVMYTDNTGASIKVWDKDKETLLVSMWERTVYTVTFETSGGTAIESVSLAYGERLDISNYVTIRSGYSFDYWILDGVEFNPTTMPDHNITLTAKWKTFALGTIKYDTDKTAISVNDEITAELFNAICLDTDGNKATFSVTVSGTQAAGETISVRLVATSGTKTKQITITEIKVYGMPTLTFDDTVDYVNLVDGLTAESFGAEGVDSFGDATEIKVAVNGEAGELVTVTIEAIDPAGNIMYGYIENVKAYGLPEIEYNEEKSAIRVNDTLSAELFNATAKDSFGESLTVSITKYSGTMSAGKTVMIRLSATDSKGNVTNIDVECKVYGVPTISGATTTDVSVFESVTAETLGVTAKDTFGQNLEIEIAIVRGSKTAGAVMTVSATATDIAGNTVYKEIDLKVYGSPIITYERTTIKVSEDAETQGASDVLGAKAIDSFGKEIEVTATFVSGSFIGGETVIYKLTAVDKLGNKREIFTDGIRVYDVNDIEFTYSAYMSDLVKVSSKGEEFDAVATDSFGNACDISIEVAEGYTLAGGQIVSLYIVATDAAGNKVYSDLIKEIKVYDMPTYTINDTVYENSDLSFLITVYDSFGEELYAEISYSGSLLAWSYEIVNIKATDDAGNVLNTNATVLVCENGFNAKKEGADIVLVEYFGTDTEVTIPYSITKIGENAFANNTTITKVTVQNSVKSIGYRAFMGCTSLQEITLPFIGNTLNGTSNTHFGYIFGASAVGSNSTSVPVSLKKVKINAGNSVASYAFWNCSHITSVELPSTIASISSNAFYGCTALKDINISESVTYIGNEAFYNCSNLTSIEIPSKLESIGSSVFYNCSGLTGKLVIPEKITILGQQTFYNCSNISEVEFSSNLQTVGASAFYNCSGLTNVIIPDGLMSIESSAFSGCSGLTNIEIPASVIKIGAGAFSGCSGLTSITLPFVGGSASATTASSSTLFGYIFGSSSYTGGIATQQYYSSSYSATYYIPINLSSVTVTGGKILYGAFYGCSGLTSVTIKDDITSIGKDAFYNCDGLIKVNYTGTIDGWAQIEFGNSLANPLFYAKKLYINNIEVTEVNLIAATEIFSYAFYNCSSLTSATIGDSVTSIGRGVFHGCSSLQSIILPFVGASKTASSGYDEVFGYIFGYTTSSSSSSIAGAIYQYQNYPTYYHYYIPTNLKAVTVTGGSIGYGAFKNCSNLTSVTIGYGVESIGRSAFYNCSGLTSVTIGNNVKSIGEDAFYNCDGLEKVNYTGAIDDWVKISFSNYDTNPLYYAKRLYINEIEATEINLTTTTTISDYAFYNCSSLTCVSIGDNVKSIGEDAFYNCDGLTKVNYAFYNCSSLTHMSIGDNVKSIGDRAFSGCSNLTNLTIGGSVTSIGQYAFSGCSKLTSITIPYSVKSVGNHAFYNCSKLASVTIGYGVKNIGNYAFYNCSALTSIKIPDNVKSIGSYAFRGCSNLKSASVGFGWWCAASSTATSGTDIFSGSSYELSTAATYLTSTYSSYYWKRS